MNSFYFNTTGYSNTANGFDTLLKNTTGYSNTALGSNALFENTTGYFNTAVAYASLLSNTTGDYNTGSGFSALRMGTTGNNNTASGTNALRLKTTGSNNTALGYGAGYSLTTGSNNIIIGYNNDLPAVNSASMLSIGNLIYATGLSNFSSVSSAVSTGNIGIGTATPSGKFHSKESGAQTAINYSGYLENISTNTTTDGIKKYGLYITSTGDFTGSTGASTNNYGIYIATTSGGDNNYDIYAQSGAYLDAAGNWTNASGKGLKENFITLDPNDILNKINLLSIYELNYKTQDSSKRHIGPMAEDFFNQFHLGGQDGDKSISTIDPAWVAIVGIQALSKRVGDLELRVSCAGVPSGSSDGLDSLITQSITNFFSSVSDKIVNGVYYFKDLLADKITAKKLCLEDICITKDELQQILANNEAFIALTQTRQSVLSNPSPSPLPLSPSPPPPPLSPSPPTIIEQIESKEVEARSQAQEAREPEENNLQTAMVIFGDNGLLPSTPIEWTVFTVLVLGLFILGRLLFILIRLLRKK